MPPFSRSASLNVLPSTVDKITKIDTIPEPIRGAPYGNRNKDEAVQMGPEPLQF
jgi:hypothetical protein